MVRSRYEEVYVPKDVYTPVPQRVIHFVTAEELERLAEGDRSRLFDYHLVFLGASLGFAIPSLEFVLKVQSHDWPSLSQGFSVLAFVACLTAAICCKLSSNRSREEFEQKIAEIKRRRQLPFRSAKERDVHDVIDAAGIAEPLPRNRSA